MDPNASLNDLREWARYVLDNDEAPDTETRAAECFDALDQWISSGGFLPDAWIGGMRS